MSPSFQDKISIDVMHSFVDQFLSRIKQKAFFPQKIVTFFVYMLPFSELNRRTKVCLQKIESQNFSGLKFCSNF